MSDQAVQRVGQWWVSLDETTKSMFEQIFAEQPELAMRVLSGGTVTAPDGATSLDDVFGGGDPFATISPAYNADLPVVDPEYPEVGTAFTVTYTVANYGTDAPADRNDVVRVLDADQNVVAEERLAGLALPQGGSESMQVTVASGAPADGRYNIEVWVNLDGGAWGGPANEHGSQTQTGTSLVVGAYESAAGPASADQTFAQEARMLENDAQTVQSFSHDLAQQLEPFRQFLTRAMTVVDAAVGDYPDWTRGPGFSRRLGDLANSLGLVDPENIDWQRADADEAGVNLHQAALPFSTVPYDRYLLDTYVPPLVDAATEVFRCYR
jgi:hypothetical protein